jgi:outer membrane lipoprotein-sorting protein
MLRRVFLLAVALNTAVLIAGPAHADDAEAIMKRAIEKDALTATDAHATVTMTVTLDDGATESKTFEIWSKKKDGLLRTVVRFTAPSKIAGTSFLLLQRPGQGDEQWVYLPAYKKARRITAKERTTAFAGSDLAYADLERRELREGAYKKLTDESIGKDACNVIESVPKDGKAFIYGRVLSWLRKNDDIPLRTQFFGTDGKLEKTLFTRKVKTISGRAVITEARIERPGSKRATDLRLDDVTFDVKTPDSFFTVAALEGGA